MHRPSDLSGTLGDDRLDASSGVVVEMAAVVWRKWCLHEMIEKSDSGADCEPFFFFFYSTDKTGKWDFLCTCSRYLVSKGMPHTENFVPRSRSNTGKKKKKSIWQFLLDLSGLLINAVSLPHVGASLIPAGRIWPWQSYKASNDQLPMFTISPAGMFLCSALWFSNKHDKNSGFCLRFLVVAEAAFVKGGDIMLFQLPRLCPSASFVFFSFSFERHDCPLPRQCCLLCLFTWKTEVKMSGVSDNFSSNTAPPAEQKITPTLQLSKHESAASREDAEFWPLVKTTPFQANATC